MPKTRKPFKATGAKKTEDFFLIAWKQEDAGNMRAAFRLYCAGAEAGDATCQLNLGNLYDAGVGVRRDRAAALYWYKKAYRQGDPSAANNIGVMWRNEKRWKQALNWFRKAIALGDEESNLEIAKYYLTVSENPARAKKHLRIVAMSNRCTESGVEEARLLLKELR